MLQRLIDRIRHRRFCRLNGFRCPDCIYHDFAFEGAIFRGNKCLWGKEKKYEHASQEYEVDAEPVKHGEWRYDEALELEWCSECGFGKRKGDKRWYSYCPNCGAYMGVEE